MSYLMKSILYGVLYSHSMTMVPASPSYLDRAFRDAAESEGVPEELLRAVCWVESSHRVHAFAEDDGGKGNHAIGVCQLILSSAIHAGWKEDSSCRTPLPKVDRKFESCTLFGPRTNTRYAAKILRRQLDRYRGDWTKAVAAYNVGSLRWCTSGRVHRAKKPKELLYTCEVGGILNQKYVDRVFTALGEER